MLVSIESENILSGRLTITFFKARVLGVVGFFYLEELFLNLAMP
jgi:hypothetical protein